MVVAIRLLIVVGMVLCLSSITQAAEGPAVFYKPRYTPSACYGDQDKGVMVAGLSDALWKGKSVSCGKRYRVRCIRPANLAVHPCKDNQSVEVTVVDYCRPKCSGVLNLSLDAFSQIADPNAGKVIVQYDEI